MKSILCALLCSFALCATASPGELLVNNEGYARITPKSSWRNTGVVITDRARQYDEYLYRAYKNPDTRVVVEKRTDTKKDDFFHLIKTTRSTKGILYDKKTNTIDTVEINEVTAPKRILNSFVVALCLAVLSMVVSNVLYVLSWKFTGFAFSFAGSNAAFAVALAAVFALGAFAVVAALTAAVVIFVAVAVFDASVEATMTYIGASVVFYICSLGYLLFYFIA
jgi:hypothetical protein